MCFNDPRSKIVDTNNKTNDNKSPMRDPKT